MYPAFSELRVMMSSCLKILVHCRCNIVHCRSVGGVRQSTTLHKFWVDFSIHISLTLCSSGQIAKRIAKLSLLRKDSIVWAATGGAECEKVVQFDHMWVYLQRHSRIQGAGLSRPVL
jgi:hypothetical protein